MDEKIIACADHVTVSNYGPESLVRVCDIPVHSFAHEAVLAEMDRNIQGPRGRKYISITNTESMYHARRILEHRNYIENATFSLCDGMGVVIGGRFRRRKVERFNGPVLLEKCSEYGIGRNWRHFFCGGKEGVAQKLEQELGQRFPGMVTAGTYCPPFREMTEDEVSVMIRKINESKPDLVWVGLGLLKQEAWIRHYIDQINVPWLIGVGAAFDYHAGTARWAPAWIRRIGFEWLYRLCFEPRMFKRNVRSFIFLAEALSERVFGKAPIIGGKL